MPTKTKAKPQNWAGPEHRPVTVRNADLNRLFETVNIDPLVEPDKATKFAADIQTLLNCRAHKIAQRLEQPLAAHVVAALKPIEEHAAALAALLHPNDLSLPVQHAIDMPQLDDGSAWDLVTRLHLASQAAMNVLGARSGSGQKTERYAQELEHARAALNAFFEAMQALPDSRAGATVLQEYEADRKEFIAICSKYLPKPPSAKPTRHVSANPFYGQNG